MFKTTSNTNNLIIPFDYSTQKDEAQTSSDFAIQLAKKEKGGWWLSHIGHWRLSNTQDHVDLLFDIKIPKHE